MRGAMFFANGHFGNEAVALPIFGHEHDASLDCAGSVGDAKSFAVEADGACDSGPEAGQRF